MIDITDRVRVEDGWKRLPDGTLSRDRAWYVYCLCPVRGARGEIVDRYVRVSMHDTEAEAVTAAGGVVPTDDVIDFAEI